MGQNPRRKGTGNRWVGNLLEAVSSVKIGKFDSIAEHILYHKSTKRWEPAKKERTVRNGYTEHLGELKKHLSPHHESRG